MVSIISDPADVRDYLERTGRGNNREAGTDAAALMVPDGAPLDSLIALLCLRHLAAEDLADKDIVELADEIDPTDDFLAREVSGLEAYAPYIDGLMAASYGAPDALERLQRSRTGRRENGAELSAQALDLLGPIVEGVRAHLGADDVDLVDGSEGRAPVVLELAARIGRAVHVDGDGEGARAARRCGALLSLTATRNVAASAVRIDSVLGMDAEGAINRVDLLSKELGPSDLGVLLGPAALLTDVIRDPRLEVLRDQQLRDGVVRAAVRLPRNLYRKAPRQNQALWIVSSVAEPGRPVASADLGSLDASTVDPIDLANDLVAAAGVPRNHHFSYLVPRAVADLLAARRVVAPGVRADQLAVHANPQGEFQDRVRRLNEHLPQLAVFERNAPVTRSIRRTIRALQTQGHLVIRSGTRLRRDWASDTGTVTTFGVADWDGIRFDQLDLAAHVPHARRTEAGDVVFTCGPPRATVDRVGGHLIASPARVLRLRAHAPIGPHTLAAQINELASTARDAEAWTVRVDLAADLEIKFAAIADLRADLLSRIQSLDHITHLLVDGTSGLTVELPTRTREDH